MKKLANPVDRHVGARLRQQRANAGLSQQKLGKAMGITFQQVQKYEKGANRIGASRLQSAARVLGVPVNYFFDGLPAEAMGFAEADVALHAAFAPDPEAEAAALLAAFARVRDRRLRARIVALVEAVAASRSDQP
jgi:transcriptional regulator with XRE-family HTH domain